MVVGGFFCIKCDAQILVISGKIPCILETKLYSPVKYAVLNFGTGLGEPSLPIFSVEHKIKPNLFLNSELVIELIFQLSQTEMK